MNGIICIDKSENYTSFDVIARLRGMLKIRRLGHAGTLDPNATGVLPVFVGRATRLCDILPDDSKSYLADFKLGITSTTQDIWGEVLSHQSTRVSAQEIKPVLTKFTGNIFQIPPMVSAVQVGGVRLYDLARQGIEVERKERPVEIRELKLLSFDEEKQEGALFVDCSKGTYVRTLCHDIGGELNTGCVLSGLRRTRSGCFTEKDCITIEQANELAAQGKLVERILPPETVFEDFEKVKLDDVQTVKFINGVKLDLPRIDCKQTAGTVTVYSDENAFLGLAKKDTDTKELVLIKLLAERGTA